MRRALDSELRRAWINNEFVLYFQPQVRSHDAAIVGAEALLRWQHPTRGVVAPALFIEALAESAISLEVGRWILATACRNAVSWREKEFGNLRVAVNLFAVHFRQGTLLQDVKDALQQSGLPPEALELEITENIALFQDEALLSPLRELRAMGVSIAFDDFGTGYASLSCLTSYPLTRIKIDRSFVQKASVDSAPESSRSFDRLWRWHAISTSTSRQRALRRLPGDVSPAGELSGVARLLVFQAGARRCIRAIAFLLSKRICSDCLIRS